MSTTNSQLGPIHNVAVLGLGTMGHGIVQTMAIAGCHVRAFDDVADARESLVHRIRANLAELVARELMDEASVPDVVDRIAVCETESEAVAGAQFVTEAVVEDLAVKQELFQRLESAVEPTTILASNTSSFPVTEIAASMRHPERAIVTHWFNPPHIVPVVEVVPGEMTSADTTQIAYDFLAHIGKTPIRVNMELPGFLVNRVQTAMFREIWDLLDRGVATAEEIDRAIRGSVGLRLAAIGPLAIIDFAGWDVTTAVYKNLIPSQRSDTELPARIQQLVDAGHYGAKSGRGIFQYPQNEVGKKIAERDATYLELIKLLRFLGREEAG